MKLTLAQRLFTGITLMLAIVAAVAAVGYYGVGRVGNRAAELSGRWMPAMDLSADIGAAANTYRRSELSLVLSKTPQMLSTNQDMLRKNKDTFEKAISQYKATIQNPQELKLFDDYISTANAYYKASDVTIKLVGDGKADDAGNSAMGESRTLFFATTDKLNELDKWITVQAQAAGLESKQAVTTASWSMMIGVAAALAAAVIVGMVLTASIRGPINSVVGVLESIATKDLSKPKLGMTVNDEIGRLARATDQMSESLRDLIRQVANTSSEVAAAATQVAASSEELSSTVRNQEQSAQQVASAMSQMSSSVTEVASKAQESSRSAAESRERATASGQLVKQTVGQIESISSQFSELVTVVGAIEKQGEKVENIVQVIQEIADQTNLLALNAAIEAARAGEHGRGFAVVADEVRKLAERTTNATTEVSTTIGAMREGMHKAVDATTQGQATVNQGRELGNKAGNAVEVIVGAQVDAEKAASNIAAATHQQSSAVEEISRSIEQMSAANSQSASAASQSASAAISLSKRAEELQVLTRQFRLV